MRLVYVVVVSVLVLAAPAATGDRVVETLSGAVRGRLVRDLNVTYYAYLGIPYAEAPTGQLRFKVSILHIRNPTSFNDGNRSFKLSNTWDTMGTSCCYLGTFVLRTAR
ncbi:hypothetical protein JYU34_005786 [Plutella xylostella]|uniref:Carboxylesterase type B domain-containing protein n=1 Tax=Plutella xylostella TaxID=51655 RepID=A0ABQ7QU47_PLUXY|nr:hypothetical protein JYU34_005786 [Plutella xylostella]